MEMDFIKKFESADTTDFPDFDSYEKPLERGLWVLWVSKEKLGTKRLTAEQIAVVVRDVKEISIDAKSITNSFNRAGDKIHTYFQDNATYFEIMKPGKEYLLSQMKVDSVRLFYFEPDKRYTSKRVLSRNILASFHGDLRIVDPYCGQRCLDILSGMKNRRIKFLTKVGNLSNTQRNQLIRDIADFRAENPNVEFRNYAQQDLHDRYIVSPDFLVILGHSIKDLGSKESFAVVLNKDSSKNMIESLMSHFDERWAKSSVL